MNAPGRRPRPRSYAWWSLCVLAANFCSFSSAVAEPEACDQCKDLCQLVDWYQQREKGVELWSKYAPSTAGNDAITPEIAAKGVGNQVFDEFTAWAKERSDTGRIPCVPPPDPKAPQSPPPQSSPPKVDLQVMTQDDQCEIFYEDKKLDKQVLKDFEDAQNCKVLSDATIAHETIHQMHCQKAYYDDHAGAPALLRSPAFVAESELQAWTKHKEVIGEGIRRIAGKCGWQPTARQKKDPYAIPSSHQTTKMRERGWKAAKALRPKGNKP